MKLGKLATKVQTADLRQVTSLTVEQNYGQGRGGRPWRRKRARILARDQYTCQVEGCGVIDVDAEVDHKIPTSQGGTDDDSNLQTICRPCHRAKSMRESQAARGVVRDPPRRGGG